MRIIWACLFALVAAPASAQEVRDCIALDRSKVILNPLDMNARTYANGEVSLAVVHDGRSHSYDSLFVLVYAPDLENETKRNCRMIGQGEGRGYTDVRLRAAVADYTAADGLTVEVPARIFRKEDGSSNTTLLSVNVNRTTNEITVTQELGTE